MIHVGCTERGREKYEQACEFAAQVYHSRLGVEITAFPPHIIFAEQKERIIGTFGFNPGEDINPLLVETYFDFDILEFLSEGMSTDRRIFGEIGTLTVDKTAHPYLSQILAAALVAWSRHHGYEYLALTTTKVVQRMARPLGIRLVKIGNPDLSRKDDEFRAKWEKYFNLRPDSMGVIVRDSFEGCCSAIHRWKDEVNSRNLLN